MILGTFYPDAFLSGRYTGDFLTGHCYEHYDNAVAKIVRSVTGARNNPFNTKGWNVKLN